MTEPQLGGTYEDLLAAARWCERNGLVSLARSDHYHWSHEDPVDATDAFATLAGLARETKTLRLCVLVTPITFRHPAVIAKNAATIDQMSGGRLDLGVGTGWNEHEHVAFGMPFFERSERFDRLVETMGYLKAAFAPGRNTFAGEHYQLDANVTPNPTGLNLIVGGSGPRRTPTMAGNYADEYNTFIGSPEKLAPRLEVVRAAAARAGRDPAAIRVSMMGPILTGTDAAEYRDAVQRAAAERGVTIEELESRLDEHGMPHGTPDRVGEAFAELEKAGVQRIYLQHFDLTDLQPLDPLWAAVSAAITN